MQCKIVLCEGEHDCCFILPLSSWKECYIAKRGEMKKVERFIRRFWDKKNVLIIHECGGKPNLYEEMKKLISKLRDNPFKMVLMLDQNTEDVFQEIKNEINNFVNTPSKFGGVWKPTVMDDGNKTLNLTFGKGYISDIFLVIVPESLEKRVAEKLEAIDKVAKMDFHAKLNSHDLISLVVEKRLLSRVENHCDVFKLAASAGWFRCEPWLHSLSQLLVGQ